MKKIWVVALVCVLLIVTLVGSGIWINRFYVETPEINAGVLERIELSEKNRLQKDFLIGELAKYYQVQPDVVQIIQSKNEFRVSFRRGDIQAYPMDGYNATLTIWFEEEEQILLNPFGSQSDVLTQKEGRDHITKWEREGHFYTIFPFYYSETEAFIFKFPSYVVWNVDIAHAYGGFRLSESANTMKDEYGIQLLQEFSIKYAEILRDCPKE